jgi:serine/threonine protein kinase
VGLLAITAAYLHSKRKSRNDKFQYDPRIHESLTVRENYTHGNSVKSATGGATIAPTTVGLSLPAHLEVSSADYRYGKLLASGGGGEVFLGEAISDDLIEICRLIVIKRPNIVNEEGMKLFEQEISIMYLLSTSNFVAKIVGFMLRAPVLLAKLYTDGSLVSFAAKKVLRRKWILCFASDIARGLLDIHNAQIAHCDIKPQNVLIDRDSKGNPFCVITDFGIARVLSEKLLVVKYSEVVSVRGLSTEYAAPEVFKRFRNKNETQAPNVVKAGDIYAVAMSVYFFTLPQRGLDIRNKC